jgi:hypothetical protein
MIYLLETGICLSLLYLAYWLFLRKETYFGFNRIFLVGSIALALLVPLLHLNFLIPQGSSLEYTASGIVKFQDSYEQMIRVINADFGEEPGPGHTAGALRINRAGPAEGGIIPLAGDHGSNAFEKTPLSGILLIIYICGVVYFLFRFVYLVFRLLLLTRRNRVTKQEGFRMVEIEEQISPFSFFRFLFINNRLFSDSELHHVLLHEKAHIKQQHSMDHLFAHGLAVFQWFNPFAWQIRNALKTTHEYIADRQVLDGGIERFDYQSLLLRQVIGYHSTELVNNFNLKPIKKRIAMMNKNRSGILARFKAVLVLPFAILIFLLFADFTLKGSGDALMAPGNPLSGLWVKQGNDNFPNILYIKDNAFSYLEGMEIREYYLSLDDNTLILSEWENATGIHFKYENRGDELILWWNDTQKSRYLRSRAENTLDHYLEQQAIKMEMELPLLTQYRLMDEDLVFRICYGRDSRGGNALTFNGNLCSLADLEDLVEKEKNKHNKLDQSSLTALFLVDRSIPMILVDQVRKSLRDMNALHFAEGGYPHGSIDLSPMLYHSVALPRLLPPLEAKRLDEKEVEKKGGKVHIIDLAARNTTPRDVDEGLTQFLLNNENGKYVISLEYDGAIPYGQYVETVDMIFNVVYRFRNELASEKFGLPYDKLGKDLQREMRKAYPMALSELMKQ